MTNVKPSRIRLRAIKHHKVKRAAPNEKAPNPMRRTVAPKGVLSVMPTSDMSDARQSDHLYMRAETALNGPFRHLPLLTIFGERNDPFGFQPRWKTLFPEARLKIEDCARCWRLSNAR